MDDRNNSLPRKAEPGFEADQTGGVAAAHDDAVADDMPFWLKEPAASASAVGRWKHTALLWGGSLLTLAVVFAGAMWLFDEHSNERAMAVVAHSQLPAAPVAPAQAAPPRPSGAALPPLVLLAPAKPEAAKVAAPVAVAPVLAPPTVRTKPPAARIAAKAPSKAQHKALLAKNAAPGPKARRPAGARKPLVLAKHTAPIARGKSKVQAAVQFHRCQPGELARECLARQ